MTLAERYCAIRKAAVTDALRRETEREPRDVPARIDAFFSALSQTEEGRASAERIEQTGMV